MTEREFIQSQIDFCVAGQRDASTYAAGMAWLWLMGWADWSIELQLLEERGE